MKDSTRQQADALAGARPPLLLTATADTSPEKSSSARLAALARRGSALARTALAGLSAATLLTATSCANPGDGPLGGGAANGQGTGAMVGAGAALGTGSTGAGGTGIPLEVLDDTGQVVDCAALVRPPTPLRRLTRFEYNNTVRDLLGTSLTAADGFPKDEVADGFSNNALVLTISTLHAEKYTLAAEALAAEALTRLPALLPCDPASAGAEACAQQFASSFGARAFRRHLEPEDLATLMEAYALGDSFEKGIEIMIRAALQSPHFLFRVEFSGAQVGGTSMVKLDGFEVANRLSYLIWSSMPDEALLSAAERGELTTVSQVEAQARRMLQDPKARVAVAEFYRQWMELSRLGEIGKAADRFPLWSEALRGAMIEESNAIIEDLVFGPQPTIEQLLTAPLGMPKGPLAELYGVAESATITSFPTDQRSGILTLPGFMSVQAHPDQTSPVLRGHFIQSKLLCNEVPPPPDDVDATPPETEGGTARERFSAHATGSCAACHMLMDPLGFPFENFDSIGAYRTTDEGRELDLSGSFVGTRDIDGDFVGVQEMAARLAQSDQVSDCVATQWFKYAMGRGTESGDACSLSPLQDSFADGGTNLLELLVGITQTEAFLYRRASTPAGTP